MQSAWTLSADTLTALLFAAAALACLWFAVRLVRAPVPAGAARGPRVIAAALLGLAGAMMGAAALFLLTFTPRLF
jgi:hypothetical protein